MYALAQPSDNGTPSATSAYASGLAPQPMQGAIPVPQNDGDLAALIQQSKAAYDGSSGQPRQDHIDAVSQAVQGYYNANPGSSFAGQVMTAMHNDPAINLSNPHADFLPSKSLDTPNSVGPAQVAAPNPFVNYATSAQGMSSPVYGPAAQASPAPSTVQPATGSKPYASFYGGPINAQHGALNTNETRPFQN